MLESAGMLVDRNISADMPYADLPDLREILPGIASRAIASDQSGEWPAEDLRVLAAIGAMRWAVPMACGGEAYSPIEMHFRYEAIASASLATALILSQRDAAVGLIEGATNTAARDRLLPQLARNEVFTTVGIAQLTTSRQHGTPALTARREGNEYVVSGEIPWSTGAAHCAFVIAGAALQDDPAQQILFALPTDAAGVSVRPPMALSALRSTYTTGVSCSDVRITNEELLAGPMERVLQVRKTGLSIGQAFMALGLTCGAINSISTHPSALAEKTKRQLEQQLATLRARVLDFCNPANAPDAAEAPRLRGDANDLAVRSTHAAVAIHKGAALLLDHPAQRLAREAMFLLVWSCPDAVIDCTVEQLVATRRNGE